MKKYFSLYFKQRIFSYFIRQVDCIGKNILFGFRNKNKNIINFKKENEKIIYFFQTTGRPRI